MTGRAADVVVVGGGPAGATVALRLADLGHAVLLVERSGFPRNHVGEALGPGVRVQIDFLGLSGLLDAVGGLSFISSGISWGTVGFVRRPADPRSVTVDRADFDRALLDAAKARGVTVLQPCAARDVRAARQGWELVADAAGGPMTIAARFVLDASGRRGFLPRRRRRISPPTVALYGYWTGTGLPAEPIVWAGRRHWIWGSPVPGRGFNAMVFTDRSALRDGSGTLADRYRVIVERSPLFSASCRSALAGPVSVCDATSYVDEASAGSGYLKVGEAAFALDPLSSTGVQKAIQTGLTAAAVINTALRRPESEDLARQFYLEQQGRTVAQHAAWAAAAYRENGRYANEEFWRKRAAGAEEALARPAPAASPEGPADWAPDDRVVLSSRTVIRNAPVLVGDLIEERRVLEHPSLAGPIAFIGGVDIVRHLERTPASTAGALVEQLRSGEPPGRAEQIMDWLVSSGIVDLETATPCRVGAGARRR